MKKKIIGIFVCMLMIATALTATGAMNFQATWLVNENNYFQPNQNTPANSPSLITINIVAKVYSVDDPDNLLGGVIKINDTIKGKYTYDSNATDTEPDPAIGIYWYYSSPCRIEIKAGGFVFKTDPNNVEFGIGVANDLVYPYPQGDMYEIASFNNSNLSNGYIVTGIDWLLYDSSGTALSSDSLPTTAPVLSKWNQSTTGFGLTFNAFNPSNNSHFYIKADVTKDKKS